MCCRSGTKALATVLVAAAALGGCSSTDLYLDRRETISLASGDAMASNRVTQMVDPWSPPSANRNIAFNGEKMQTASERYRTGRIIPPVNATTSSVAYSQAQQQAQPVSNTQATSAPAQNTVK